MGTWSGSGRLSTRAVGGGGGGLEGDRTGPARFFWGALAGPWHGYRGLPANSNRHHFQSVLYYSFPWNGLCGPWWGRLWVDYGSIYGRSGAHHLGHIWGRARAHPNPKRAKHQRDCWSTVGTTAPSPTSAKKEPVSSCAKSNARGLRPVSRPVPGRAPERRGRLRWLRQSVCAPSPRWLGPRPG